MRGPGGRAASSVNGKSARSYCAALVSPITIAAGLYEPREEERKEGSEKEREARGVGE